MSNLIKLQRIIPRGTPVITKNIDDPSKPTEIFTFDNFSGQKCPHTYCELHPKRVKKDDPACYGFMKWDNTETNESITSCPQIGGDDNKITIGDSHVIQKFGPDRLNLEDYVK